jgi:hypothetical protein
MQITDPQTIPQSSLPLFVFSDSATDFIAFLITWRTKGTWNHAMLLANQDKFAAQAWTYAEVPIAVYMKKGSRLEFFSLVNTTANIEKAVQDYVSRRLAAPWWHKVYDFVGILGQAVGMPKIHTPGLEYCSVDVTNCLKTIANLLPTADQATIDAIPNEINPQDLHDYMVMNPKTFALYGQYEADEGIQA